MTFNMFNDTCTIITSKHIFYVGLIKPNMINYDISVLKYFIRLKYFKTEITIFKFIRIQSVCL